VTQDEAFACSAALAVSHGDQACSQPSQDTHSSLQEVSFDVERYLRRVLLLIPSLKGFVVEDYTSHILGRGEPGVVFCVLSVLQPTTREAFATHARGAADTPPGAPRRLLLAFVCVLDMESGALLQQKVYQPKRCEPDILSSRMVAAWIAERRAKLKGCSPPQPPAECLFWTNKAAIARCSLTQLSHPLLPVILKAS